MGCDMKKAEAVHQLKDPCRLTPAEEKIYVFMKDGKGNKEISQILNKSIHSVETYTQRIKEKISSR